MKDANLDTTLVRSEWLTEREIASDLAVSPFTVARWRKADGLKAIRLGRSWRVRRDWLAAWLEAKANRDSSEPGEHKEVWPDARYHASSSSKDARQRAMKLLRS